MTNIDGYKITTRPTRPDEDKIVLPFAYNANKGLITVPSVG